MSDERWEQSENTDGDSAAESGPRGWRRYRIPLGVLLLVAAVFAWLWGDPLQQFDRGMQRIYSCIAAAVAATLLVLWYVCLSGAGRVRRVAVIVAVLLLLGGVAVAVRDVEFTGDMQVLVDWRWNRSQQGKLTDYLSQRPAELLALAPATLTVADDDWPEYRGLHRDGVVSDLHLRDDWSSTPPEVLWKQPCGGGYASFAVVGNQAVTIEQRGPDEVIVSYDTETGAERWAYAYQALFSETLGGDGPRATPTYDNGRIYSLGATGRLVCLNAADGSRVWATDILADNEVANLTWGMSGSPLVYQQMVIVSPGNQKGNAASSALLGFDAETGELRWRAGQSEGSYASPMVVTLLGREQILNFDAAGLAGYVLDSEEPLWEFSWTSDFDINAAQPVVVDEQQVLISSSSGTALVQLVETEQGIHAEEVWSNKRMKADFACPVVWQGHAYGLDKGILVCLDVADGTRRWKEGRYGHGQLLLVDGCLLVLTETGKLALVEATPEDFKQLAELDVLEGKTWNNPAVAGAKLYVRNHLEMACLRIPTTEPLESDTEIAPEPASAE